MLEVRDARILELLAEADLEDSRVADLLSRLARSDDRVNELLEVVDVRDAQIVALAVEVEGLLASQEFRGVIEQAKGVIMSTMQCSADAAFAILVAQSSAENRKLRDIAIELAALQDRG
jgi:AmiR/NasT family two-component response regulator